MKLEVGAAETIVEEKPKSKGRTTLTGGKGSGNGRNRGGGGGGGGNNGGGDKGGGNNPGNQNLGRAEQEFKPDKFRIVTWFLLLVVMMTFGALISAYIVVSTNGVLEWKPFNFPTPTLVQICISTALILTSSLTYKISNAKLQAGDQTNAKKWLLATTALGATFISSQILVWLELVRQGVYVRSNPYAGFFYILTVIHAAHVLGGIVALGYIVLRTWHETIFETELLRRQMFSKVVGWYWHFMDALWIVLVLLLGFYK